MSTHRTAATVLAALLLAASARPAAALKIETIYRAAGLPATEVVAGEALVRFDPAKPPAERSAALASIGAALVREFPYEGWTGDPDAGRHGWPGA